MSVTIAFGDYTNRLEVAEVLNVVAAVDRLDSSADEPNTCLLLWDSSRASVDDVARLAESLLERGCINICCWGEGCERVHDIFDEVDAYRRVMAEEAGDPEGPFVMSTWHDTESLHEAIWYALVCARPPEPLPSPIRFVRALVIANTGWASEVRSAFDDAETFVSNHLRSS